VEIIPAIDIRGGKCVRLQQGDYDRETVFGDDPVAMALRWSALGASYLHVVDLDAARGHVEANAEVVRQIVQAANASVQIGGGIRSMEAIRGAFEAGAGRVVLGTAAVKDPTLLREAIAFARDRIVVSVDARAGMVSLQGWTESTDIDAVQLIDRLASMGVKRVVYTDILRDGVTDGPNFSMYERLNSATSVHVIAAGGVGTAEDIRRLRDCGVEAAILGRALYTGELQLTEALAAAA
jgi:phosphoribosylformimino-5-aminoimidazole carboxamide ribotide isomerase